MNRRKVNRAGKAAVNTPQSKRFANCEGHGSSRQRLECGGFSTAFGVGYVGALKLTMDLFIHRASQST